MASALNLNAHFDGEHIVLDEPVQLEAGTRVLVTILPDAISDADREELLAMSWQSFQDAYSEEEIDYPLEAIKEFNPDYEGS